MKRWKAVRAGGIVALAVFGMFHIGVGCARVQPYEPRPLQPAQSESAFRARTLDDPGLRDFMRKDVPAAADSWPVKSWDLESLTAAAVYFHQDIKVALAQIGVAQAGETTAAMRPNPTLSLAIAPPWATDSISTFQSRPRGNGIGVSNARSTLAKRPACNWPRLSGGCGAACARRW